jgi:hypothetical protein
LRLRAKWSRCNITDDIIIITTISAGIITILSRTYARATIITIITAITIIGVTTTIIANDFAS